MMNTSHFTADMTCIHHPETTHWVTSLFGSVRG